MAPVSQTWRIIVAMSRHGVSPCFRYIWSSFDIFIRCSIPAKSSCMWNQVVSQVWFVHAKEEEEEVVEEENPIPSTQECKNIALPTHPYLVKNKKTGTFLIVECMTFFEYIVFHSRVSQWGETSTQNPVELGRRAHRLH